MCNPIFGKLRDRVSKSQVAQPQNTPGLTCGIVSNSSLQQNQSSKLALKNRMLSSGAFWSGALADS